MSFYLAQAGNALYSVDQTTGVGTALTLPSGITLDTTLKPHFAMLGDQVVMVNSPSRNLSIGPDLTVRVLIPRPPVNAPRLSASGTGLTGAYTVRASFYVLGQDNVLISESPLSPVSNSVTLANEGILATGVPIAVDTISGVRLYRTAAGGTTYFRWVDKDDNEGGSLLDALADASLPVVATDPALFLSPPGTLDGTRMRNITQWQNRLWGLDADIRYRDTVTYTEANSVYQWANTLIAQPAGTDKQGVLGFLPRRNQLGLVKRTGLWQIVGTEPSNYRVIQIAGADEKAPGWGGCVALDTCIVIDNIGYWLGKDGVYEWTDDGLRNISKDQVHPWFTTDTYFNRARFPNAFAGYNSAKDILYFHLAAVGSSTENRWVGFDRRSRVWFGPHQTGLFTPTTALLVEDDSETPLLLVGGSAGVIYKANQDTRTDGASTAIDFDVIGKFHDGDAPDIEHHWGDLSVLSRIESAGTLQVIPRVGRLNAEPGAAMLHTLTTGRERLGRVGDGAMVQLRFRENTAAQDVSLFGYELPFAEHGRR